MRWRLLPAGLRTLALPALFGGRTGKEPRHRRRTRPRPSALESLDFSTLTLDEILRLEPGILATRLHVITLRRFKDSIGDEWDRLADKVGMIADGIVRRYLGPKTVCGRHGDDTFILSFTGQSESEGRRQAVVIANELMHRLIGERFVGAQICVAEVAPDDLRGVDGEPDVAALDSVVAEAAPVVTDGPRHGESAGIAESPAPVRLSTAGPDRTIEVAGPRWVPLAWPPEDGRYAGETGGRAFDPAEALPPGLGIAFRPTWGARWQAIDAYLCLPRRADADRTVTGAGVLPPRPRPGQAASLDLALLQGALTRLVESIDKRRAAPVIVPLRFATLQAPYWATVATILRSFSDAARLRYLLLEITDVPAAAGPDHMIGLGAMVRPLCRDLLVRSTLADPRTAVIRHCQPIAVGCDIAAHDSADGNIKTLLHRFSEAAGDLRFYVWGAGSRPVVAAAVALGALYVNGSAVMADMTEPAGAMAMPSEMLGRTRSA
jgi:GGDEF domain-containing protein